MLPFKKVKASLLIEQINHVGQRKLREYIKTKKQPCLRWLIHRKDSLVVVQLDVMTGKEQNEILLLIDMDDGWSESRGFC